MPSGLAVDVFLYADIRHIIHELFPRVPVTIHLHTKVRIRQPNSPTFGNLRKAFNSLDIEIHHYLKTRDRRQNRIPDPCLVAYSPILSFVPHSTIFVVSKISYKKECNKRDYNLLEDVFRRKVQEHVHHVRLELGQGSLDDVAGDLSYHLRVFFGSLRYVNVVDVEVREVEGARTRLREFWEKVEGRLEKFKIDWADATAEEKGPSFFQKNLRGADRSGILKRKKRLVRQKSVLPCTNLIAYGSSSREYILGLKERLAVAARLFSLFRSII